MTAPPSEEFAKVVAATADGRRRIAAVAVTGFGLAITMASRAGRKRWTASATFDPATGNYEGRATYPTSAELRGLLDNIQAQLRNR